MGRETWRLGVATVVAMTAWLSPAVPQSSAQTAEFAKVVGTLIITPQPYFDDGELRGCTLVFSAVHQDWTYGKGTLLKVDGYIGIMGQSSELLAARLVVVVNEVKFDGPNAEFLPAAPTRAYIVAPSSETNLAALVYYERLDTPGGLLLGFQVSPTFEMLLQSLDTNELIIAFDRFRGSPDIHLKLELNVANTNSAGERTRSPKIKTAFMVCIESLTSGASLVQP